MDTPTYAYTLLGPEGEPLAGDDKLSSFMKARADEVGGRIVTPAGTTIYPEEG